MPVCRAVGIVSGIMEEDVWLNRLTLLGKRENLMPFHDKQNFTGRYLELLANEEERIVWEYETDTVPLEEIKGLSKDWPRLTFLLEFENRVQRIKGAGEIPRRRGGALATEVLSLLVIRLPGSGILVV